MKIMKRNISPRYKRDNIESFLLISSKTTDSKNLSITLVEMGIKGIQKIHSHKPEQIYYILEGEGTMTVNNEEKKVIPGDCIFIPSNSNHGLVNTGNKKLIYLSAASPSFTRKQCEEYWPLKSLNSFNSFTKS